MALLGWTVAGFPKIQTPAKVKYHKFKTLGKLGLDQLNVLNYSYKCCYLRVKEGKKYHFGDSSRQKLSNYNYSMVQRAVEVEWELFT